MFTLTITILAVLVVAALVLWIGERLWVEEYNLSIRDFDNGPPVPAYGPRSVDPSPHTGSIR